MPDRTLKTEYKQKTVLYALQSGRAGKNSSRANWHVNKQKPSIF
jgi:hypothetical protein